MRQKKRLGLRITIVMFVVITSILTMAGYSFFLIESLHHGLGLSARARLDMEVRAYSREYAVNPNIPLPHSANFNVHRSLDEISPEILSILQTEPLINNEYNFRHLAADSDGIYVCYPYMRSDGVLLYFVYAFVTKDVSSGTMDRYYEHQVVALLGGVIFIFCMTGLVVLLVRRIARPIEDLNKWAYQLDMGNVDADDFDFKFRELNQLAELFRGTVLRVLAGVKREEQFLRNASHELRTPIAVLQNNLELLERLGVEQDSRAEGCLHRMNNAVRNMRNLTTTLLWVSREVSEEIPVALCRIDSMLAEIVEENEYLLQGKENTLSVVAEKCEAVLPAAVLRVVLSNMVRNAFQHTFQGNISIELSLGIVTVENDIVPDAKADRGESYGVGIMLMQQLTDQFSWDLNILHERERFVVSVDFSNEE
ncbi:MAG: histidine kinase dimerization/phospho-acceptor domain-containing protein [Desulfovibrio sp.]